MITRFGMSKKFGLMGLATVESQYLDGRASLTCSDVTAADIDTEVMKMLRDSYKQAKKLLKENREIMDKLAAHLIEKETITGKEFMKIYRKEKGLPEPEEEESEGSKEKKGEPASDTNPVPNGNSSQEQLMSGQNPSQGQPPMGNQNAGPNWSAPGGNSQQNQPASGQNFAKRYPMQGESLQNPDPQQGRPMPGWNPSQGQPNQETIPFQGQPNQERNPSQGQTPGSDQAASEQPWTPPHQPRPENRGVFSQAPEPRDDNKR